MRRCMGTMTPVLRTTTTLALLGLIQGCGDPGASSGPGEEEAIGEVSEALVAQPLASVAALFNSSGDCRGVFITSSWVFGPAFVNGQPCMVKGSTRVQNLNTGAEDLDRVVTVGPFRFGHLK